MQGFKTLALAAQRRIPLTFSGGIFFLASIALLAFSLYKENSYYFLFSLAVLLLLGLLLILGFLTVSSLEKPGAQLVAPGVFVAGQNNCFVIRAVILRPFSRLHVRITAHSLSGNQNRIEFKTYCRAKAHKEGSTALFLPFSGILHWQAEYVLGDLFGLTAFFHSVAKGSGVILPIPPMGAGQTPARESQWIDTYGIEYSDAQRLYTRDYQPGDRARDINWKLTEKYGKLMIRYAQGFPQEAAEISIAGIPGASGEPENGWSLAHLEVVKRSLSGFIQVKTRENNCYRFRILWGDETFFVWDVQSREAFMSTLSRLAFTDSPMPGPDKGPLSVCFASGFADLADFSRESRAELLFVTKSEKMNSGKIQLFPPGSEAVPSFPLKRQPGFAEKNMPDEAHSLTVKAVFHEK